MAGRRTLRLQCYDYRAPGLYFCTLVASERASLFGRIENQEMQANQNGSIVLEVWNQLSEHFPTVDVDSHVLMPNHLHGLLLLNGAVGAGSPRPGAETAPLRTQVESVAESFGAIACPEATGPSLGQVVAYFKYQTTKLINQQIGRSAYRPVWQRGFYEHVVRGEVEASRVRDYIVTNPLRWALDRENPASPRNH